MAGAHGNLPSPPDRRPYRRQSEAGTEQLVYAVDPSGRVTRLTLRQVGWQGQSGAFYALEGDARPEDHERGSFSPLLITAHADDMVPEDLITMIQRAISV